MRIKLASLLAATALMAACETATESDATTSGQGEMVSAAPSGAPTPGTAADFVASVDDRVHFGFDKSDLCADAQETLRKQAEWLQKYPSVTVTIQGHCDERGTTEYNLGLGERRSNAAKNFLISLGIPDARIKVISYGKERPINEGHTEAAWAENRVAITIVD